MYIINDKSTFKILITAIISLSVNVLANDIYTDASFSEEVYEESTIQPTVDNESTSNTQSTEIASISSDSSERVNRYVIDTEVSGTAYDSKATYTADIIIANHSDLTLYPFIENKVGFKYNKMPFVVEENSQTLIPAVFTAELPGHVPKNHLADTKQFKLAMSKDDETGNWGCFGKEYAVQIDAYFSQQVGLQTVHCYSIFDKIYTDKKATCMALLGSNNHIDIVIELY